MGWRHNGPHKTFSPLPIFTLKYCLIRHKTDLMRRLHAPTHDAHLLIYLLLLSLNFIIYYFFIKNINDDKFFLQIFSPQDNFVSLMSFYNVLTWFRGDQIVHKKEIIMARNGRSISFGSAVITMFTRQAESELILISSIDLCHSSDLSYS